MAVEVIDEIAREEIDAHEAAPNAHPQYLSAAPGATVFQSIDMQSPNGSIFRFTVSDFGVLQAELISGPA